MKRIIFALLLCSISAFAQQPVHEIISTEKDLPSKTVYSILQDSKGFIWIAHEKGISRYDGTKMKNYIATTSQGRACTSLQESNDGRIWFVNFDGNVYYTFANADSIFEEPRLKTKGNWSNIYYTNNCILKPTNNYLLSLNLKSNSLNQIQPRLSLGEYLSSSWQNDELLITSSNVKSTSGIRWKYKNGTTNVIPLTSKLVINDSKGIIGPIKIVEEYWLISLGNGISFLNMNSGLIKNSVETTQDLILNYYIWQNNLLWLCTTSGVYAFDKNLNPLFNGKAIFPNYSVSDILYDREGILWLVTLNGGLIKAPSLEIINHNLLGNSVISLTSNLAQHSLFIGTTYNQVFDWSFISNKTELIFNGNNNKDVSNLVFNKFSNEVYFTSDKSYALNTSTKKISELHPYCKDFDIIDKTHYAIATPFGYGFNEELATSKFKFIENSFELNKYYVFQKQNVRTRCVAYDKNEALFYAGTINGLILVKDSLTEEIKNKNESIIASDLILFNSFLFAGTLNNGILQVQTKKLTHLFNSSNGLLSNSIVKLKIFNNKLWILSDKGLQQLILETNKFVNYPFNNSLSTDEITDFEIMDNKIFLASSSGLIELPIQSNLLTNHRPLIWIDKFNCNKVNYSFEKPLVFEAGNHLIEIFLTLPNFRNTNLVKIYYQVNQSDWQKLADGEHGLTLPQLSSGYYKVKFKAECNGFISTEIPEVNFTIKTPWYSSWWFLSSCAILFIAIVYLIVKNEFRKQRIKQQFETEKNKLEKELQQSTLASIKSQMNPHFLFNALNTIQSYIYQNDKQNASQYLGKFSELTRLILEMSNREKVSLTEEIKALKLYLELEQLRFEEKLKYEIVVAKNVDADMVHIPSMLIQPYIENAIKHGLLHKKDNWLLHISFEREEKTLVVKVDDNGIGRKRSQELQKLKLKQHQSFAMSANEKRLDILNKGLSKPIALQIIDKINNNGEAMGTTIILNIPIFTTNSLSK
jgi:ligand-binding sensor domain-containing protein